MDEPCSFPFEHNRTLYFGCTDAYRDDTSNDEKWCEIDSASKSIGICKPNCLGGEF